MRAELHVPRSVQPLDESAAWALVSALSRGARAPTGITLVDGEPSLGSRRPLTEEAAVLLDLFLPLVAGTCASDFVVAHLGQSLDGRIAVPAGQSRLITGFEDVRHTHRLRAIVDAVVVGASTTDLDDPLLTTRHVPGDSPVRVVLDPRGRVPLCRRVFSDGDAPTLVLTTASAGFAERRVLPHVETLVIAPRPEGFTALAAREALRRRGLRRLLVEGGGVTVSHFLDAGLVDRVQIAVAPKIIGTGSPALALHAACAPARAVRRFLLGADVLFDFALNRKEPRGAA